MKTSTDPVYEACSRSAEVKPRRSAILFRILGGGTSGFGVVLISINTEEKEVSDEGITNWSSLTGLQGLAGCLSSVLRLF